VNIAICLVQEIILVECARIYFESVLGISSFRDEIQHVRDLIYHCAESIAKGETRNRVIETKYFRHFSGAYRAAQSEELRNLPSAQILSTISDEDIYELHQTHRRSFLPFVAFIFYFFPALCAMVHDSLGEICIEAIASGLGTAFLLANSILYSVSWIALVGLYVALIVFYLYVRFLYRPAASRVLASPSLANKYVDSSEISTAKPSILDYCIYYMSWDGMSGACSRERRLNSSEEEDRPVRRRWEPSWHIDDKDITEVAV
jgi:hypothetical protein